MAQQPRKQFMVENAQIIFRNFAGKGSQYNTPGDRNFAVVLEPSDAKSMERDGWNVKYTKPREEGDEPVPYIPVALNFDNRPPRVVMITSGGKVDLDAGSVQVLDWADIQTADLIAVAYNWTFGDKHGIRAYVKSMVVTIEEDELERKYNLNEAISSPASPDATAD